MIISGRQIVLAGRFGRLSKDEAKRGLEALGAKVTASVSAKTDLFFAGAKSGVKAGPAAVRGVPIYDEDALAAVLEGREPGTPPPSPPSPPFTGVPDERMGPDEALDTLKNADWSAFSPERDTVPLRDALQTLERAHGITGAHRLATARLRGAGALLRHSEGNGADRVQRTVAGGVPGNLERRARVHPRPGVLVARRLPCLRRGGGRVRGDLARRAETAGLLDPGPGRGSGFGSARVEPGRTTPGLPARRKAHHRRRADG